MRIGLVAGALMLLAGALPAQRSDTAGVRVRLTFEDEVRVGRAAPKVKLPYATATGPGPVAQPFDLSKELGHVVVLVFYRADHTAAAQNWRAFAARERPPFAADLVIAGVADRGVAALSDFAQRQTLPFKFLADSGGRVARAYGFTGEEFGVVVIGRDGNVVLLRPDFSPEKVADDRALDLAIRRGREIQ